MRRGIVRRSERCARPSRSRCRSRSHKRGAGQDKPRRSEWFDHSASEGRIKAPSLVLAGERPNLPVTADQLRAALGNEQVRQLAQHFGLPVDRALEMLFQHLPTVVDQASPKGTLQAGT